MFHSENINEGCENWRKTGAFCIRFSKEGHDIIVIVDDYIPIREDGLPVFARGGV